MKNKIYILVLLVLSQCIQAQTRMDYFLMEAGKYRMRQDWSQAMMLYRHALDINPDSPEALFQLGRMSFYIREDSIGESCMLRAIGIDSTNTS